MRSSWVSFGGVQVGLAIHLYPTPWDDPTPLSVLDSSDLSPLATKPQALGFALFYLQELLDQPASVLFPFSRRYERETSNGVGRVWSYEICFSLHT